MRYSVRVYELSYDAASHVRMLFDVILMQKKKCAVGGGSARNIFVCSFLYEHLYKRGI
jgi:hypothetical protein